MSKIMTTKIPQMKIKYKNIILVGLTLWLCAFIIFTIISIINKSVNIWLFVSIIGIVIGIFSFFYVQRSWRISSKSINKD
jgi:hypothetical protein